MDTISWTYLEKKVWALLPIKLFFFIYFISFFSFWEEKHIYIQFTLGVIGYSVEELFRQFHAEPLAHLKLPIVGNPSSCRIPSLWLPNRCDRERGKSLPPREKWLKIIKNQKLPIALEWSNFYCTEHLVIGKTLWGFLDRKPLACPCKSGVVKRWGVKNQVSSSGTAVIMTGRTRQPPLRFEHPGCSLRKFHIRCWWEWAHFESFIVQFHLRAGGFPMRSTSLYPFRLRRKVLHHPRRFDIGGASWIEPQRRGAELFVLVWCTGRVGQMGKCRFQDFFCWRTCTTEIPHHFLTIPGSRWLQIKIWALKVNHDFLCKCFLLKGQCFQDWLKLGPIRWQSFRPTDCFHHVLQMSHAHSPTPPIIVQKWSCSKGQGQLTELLTPRIAGRQLHCESRSFFHKRDIILQTQRVIRHWGLTATSDPHCSGQLRCEWSVQDLTDSGHSASQWTVSLIVSRRQWNLKHMSYITCPRAWTKIKK